MMDRWREPLKEGELEKRSSTFLQLWRRQWCVLTAEGLRFYPVRKWGSGGGKELSLATVEKVDCVERKGGHIYFTLVTRAGREVDFRCGEGSGWHARITLALLRVQNEQAVRVLRARKEDEMKRTREQKVRNWAS
ncbi:pleckstrin homology-like domain family A member 3 [Latimeria chalumnae]|uniref:PH domain-containing protein n=1 Tax=Latimeria chalumnae TaxID=7897 RepID=H3BEY0_LATCH|nr:PREDICTED: pleckstrin homology-like domain family A member 3 [Latimeria chalumnae]XP_005991034.1 PREDICTED: pleckstrin homology-like domain family A member 3 [Latimeria chalumnae]XP_014341009.1 PREDICTED: pleckstrin homology-like domain family A member 3 [Latimeria chalumnae]|eukprot:XP_005991033.1 PREDICTED: pleckstrin homology-like domain family A member 3 [Latimeria chalumnae]